LGDDVANNTNWQDLTRITAIQQHAAIKLAAGMSVAETARMLKIGTKTIFNWLVRHEYKLYVRNLRSAPLEESVGRLSGGALKCVDTVLALTDDPDPAIRLRAAVSGLQLLGGLRNVVEFQDRIERLEEAGARANLALEVEMVQDQSSPIEDSAHERLFRKDIDEANGRVA
jgi:HEAT repeat protein